MLDHTPSLLARMFAVAAIGVAAIALLNSAPPTIVLGDPGEVTAFVTSQAQTFVHASVKLMTVGHDVVAFIFFGTT